MSFALVRSRALLGLEAARVEVEVHLANGLPSFGLVGLADVEVKEARERVRSALQTCGLDFPHDKRITVNLARPTCPRIPAASTCRSRWASWRRAGSSTGRGWRTTSSRANCRCPGNCGRCAARWP